jgi:2-dehydro-3-deoxyphosphooctonate aldolase (KDO 8-P synthase)
MQNVMSKRIMVGNVSIGGRSPLALISGPCVIESRKGCLALAGKLAALAEAESIPFVFKASYDKANRTSVDSYRGPGIVEGLEILQEVRERFGVPITTDVHTAEEATRAGSVVDAIQIPAFLCRQTDLLLAAGETGIPVNIKKGQFLAPADMSNVIAKVESTGNRKLILTERGVSFGYNNLVADMRSLLEMGALGYPVTFDATHSVQRPGAGGTRSGGDGHWAPYLARAAVAVGCSAVFIETHVDPSKALSDGANAIRFSAMRKLWKTLRAIDDVVS